MSLTKLPLTDRVVDAIKADGVGYGWSKPASWFAAILMCKPQTTPFDLAMMEVKGKLERETGYYLSTTRKGLQYTVPCAEDHVNVVLRRKREAPKRLRKSISLGLQTLSNPTANLSPADKAVAEKTVEKATLHLFLITHAERAAAALRKFKPKLLPPSPIQR